MRKFVPLVLLLLLSCMAVADTVTMQLTGVGPGSAGGPNSGGGVYVYPYYFSINGSSTNIPLICDDYDSHIYIGESWTAVVTPLTDYLGNQDPRAASGLNKVQAYQEAAWLLSQLSGVPDNNKAVAINYAIWSLFSDNAYADPTFASSGAAGWLSQAATGINDSAFLASLSDYVVYTPKGGTQPQGYDLPQEFIGRVPEPASFMMLGSGLLGIFGFAKRRIKK